MPFPAVCGASRSWTSISNKTPSKGSNLHMCMPSISDVPGYMCLDDISLIRFVNAVGLVPKWHALRFTERAAPLVTRPTSTCPFSSPDTTHQNHPSLTPNDQFCFVHQAIQRVMPTRRVCKLRRRDLPVLLVSFALKTIPRGNSPPSRTPHVAVIRFLEVRGEYPTLI